MTVTDQLRSAARQGLATVRPRVLPWIGRLGTLMPTRRVTLLVAAALAVLVGWQLGALIWLAVAFSGAATTAASSTVPLAESFQQSNVRFGDDRSVTEGLFGERSGDERTLQQIPDEVPETRLDLALKGVLAFEEGDGFAFIETPGGDESVYGPGDELPGDARLRFVYRDRVLLSRPGGLETLRLARADSVASGSRNGRRSTAASASASFDQSQAGQTAGRLRARLMQEPAEMMRMVRFEPYEQDGELQGFRLQPRGSEYEELLSNLGLTADDVVTAINGIPLNDRGRVGEALEALRTAEQLQVQFLRDGESRSVTIPVADTS